MGSAGATSERAAEVAGLLVMLERWARAREDVVAVGLAGSWARGDPRPDSDVDVILVTRDPSIYLEETAWLSGFPKARLVRTQAWGPLLTERRLELPSCLDLEIGVTTSAWTSVDPVDEGTASVVRDGFRILHDPSGILGALVEACGRRR